MQYNLQCPRCRKKFNLNAPDPAKLLNNRFYCSSCGYSIPFADLIPGLRNMRQPQTPPPIGFGATPPPLGTQPAPGSGLKTNVAPGYAVNKKPTAGPAYLQLEKSGEKLYIVPGAHVLGRDSADSKATIKVAPDPYMSRQQAKLVLKVADGKVMAQISPLKSTNEIYVNDVAVPMGKAAVLQDGMRILLGMTKVVYHVTKK